MMKNTIGLKIDCFKLNIIHIKKLVNYFKHINAETISMTDDYLTVHLNILSAKEIKFYIFIQDIEYLSKKNVRTAYRKNYSYIYF